MTGFDREILVFETATTGSRFLPSDPEAQNIWQNC